MDEKMRMNVEDDSDPASYLKNSGNMRNQHLTQLEFLKLFGTKTNFVTNQLIRPIYLMIYSLSNFRKKVTMIYLLKWIKRISL